MAQSEQRQFEVENLNVQVTCDLAVGSYQEELYYPDSSPVPEGRTEILMGVTAVKYRQGDEWVSLDVNIADLIAENVALQERCDEQQRELNVARRRLKLYTFENEEADATGPGADSSTE